MKIFKRRNNDEDEQLDHNGTYQLDSDDDSIPPPPPPLPPYSASTDIVNMESENKTDQVSIISSVKTSNEEFIDNRSMATPSSYEKSPFMTGPNSDDMNGNPVIRANDTSSKRNGYSQVPITGQFRGMKNAQTFDEEEAGMDEIEVPSSSVVDRWNEWEKKYALRKKMKMIGLIILGVVVVIVGVTLGGVYGTRGGEAGEAGEGDVDNEGQEGTPDIDIDEEEPPDTGGAQVANYPDHLNTQVGRIIWDNAFLPANTVVDLEDQDEDSAAYKAWQWLETDDANQGYNFDLEDINEKTKLDIIQRFTLATFAYSVETDIEGWMTADDVCAWTGVDCTQANNDNGRKMMRQLQDDEDPLAEYVIKGISLGDLGIRGQIPPEIVLLQDLKNFAFFRNFLSGEIPDEMYSLPNLERLDLFDNELTGSISPQVGNLKNLVELYIGRNQFTGRIPSELFTMDQLIALWINDLVQLDVQPLSPDIANLSNLEQLRINDSQFEGNLPAEIGDMVSLKELWAARNGFDGDIPDLSKLVDLEIIDLSENWLSGELPKIRELIKLEILNLSGNVLSGNIWNHYGVLTALVELRLGPNTFDNFPDSGITGPIPQSFGALENLEILHLQDNKLTGELPDSLAELASLREFNVQGNADVEGSVPVGICQLEPILMADCDIRCACCTDDCNRGL